LSLLWRERQTVFRPYSLDIYKKFFKKDATEKQLVGIGKWVVIVAMGIAALIAPALKNLDQAYQFIQEYVGFISSGCARDISARLFLKRTTAKAALLRKPLTIPVSTVLKFLPVWTVVHSSIFPFSTGCPSPSHHRCNNDPGEPCKTS
jgi:SSS family solute:Na+ symporter